MEAGVFLVIMGLVWISTFFYQRRFFLFPLCLIGLSLTRGGRERGRGRRGMAAAAATATEAAAGIGSAPMITIRVKHSGDGHSRLCSAEAEHLLCLTRSTSSLIKHFLITVFLAPICRPIRQGAPGQPPSRRRTAWFRHALRRHAAPPDDATDASDAGTGRSGFPIRWIRS